MGMQLDPAILAAILQKLHGGGAMGPQVGMGGSVPLGGMDPGQSIFGPKTGPMPPGGMSGGIGAGVGMLGKALPFIGMAGGLLEGLGNAQMMSRQMKEQSKGRRLAEFSSQSRQAQNSSEVLMRLMQILGHGGLYGR